MQARSKKICLRADGLNSSLLNLLVGEIGCNCKCSALQF